MLDRSLPPARRQHLEVLSGPLGIWQHADGVTPDEAYGSCTDDVARALTVDLLHRHTLGWEAVRDSALRAIAYLEAAYDTDVGIFRNFRDAAGGWLEAAPSQDSQGRALRALGEASRDAPEASIRYAAASLLNAALEGADRLTSPRAVAAAVLGLDAALDRGPWGSVDAVFRRLVDRLQRSFNDVDLDADWLWPEPVLTYENALLPHAMIVAGRRLGDARMRRVGLVVLDWVVAVQTARGGGFSPIGNDGWWHRGGSRARFSQQPIEATATILALAAAFEVTHDSEYRRAAEAAYAWFLGDNDAGLLVADAERGGCHDGLAELEVNRNEGAESTLMWLTAVETMRLLRQRSTTARADGAQPLMAVVSRVRS